MIKIFVDYLLLFLFSFILLPTFLLVAIFVYIGLGKPILFIQERAGLNSITFNLYKFRTMTNNKNEAGVLLSDFDRTTKLGKILRSYSLDEIPSFLNVLRGDMSLVGPRPLLVKYLDLYTNHQKRRHQMKPGITGWSQINGRNALAWDKKFELDLWYIDNQSLLLDIKILLLTIKKVFLSEGINQGEKMTMPEFKGKKNV